MTEEEKDILILKILEHPQSLTDQEVSVILSDEELLDIYNTSLKVKDAVRPHKAVDPAKEWELLKARIPSPYQTEANSTNSNSHTPNSKPDLTTVSRRSFVARLLRNISKRPVAAAIGSFILAGAIAGAILWKSEPQALQPEGAFNGIAQNTPKNNDNKVEKDVLVNDYQSDPIDNFEIGSELIGSKGVEKDTNLSSKDDLTLSETQNHYSNTNRITPKSESKHFKSVSEPKNSNTSSTPIIQTEQNANLTNDINPQELAYTQVNINEDSPSEYELGKLDGQLPEDWDIDQCLKLQQARVDNELALAMADSRKKEYELFRENFLLEYLIANPESDQATLQEVGAYLDEYFGPYYSAIP